MSLGMCRQVGEELEAGRDSQPCHLSAVGPWGKALVPSSDKQKAQQGPLLWHSE